MKVSLDPQKKNPDLTQNPSLFSDDLPSADGTDKSTSHSSKTHPRLHDKESWGAWKMMLEESMLTEEETRHFATYLYCKINTRP